MGAWGPGLYQDDIAQDVKDYYRDQLHRGKTGVEITQELLERFQEVIVDEEEGAVFWFALADTQWKLGRLEEHVKENALAYIRNGQDLRRWEKEDPRQVKSRKKVLDTLEQKLLSPQPEEKKVSQYRLYRCQWQIGDVYAYRLEGEEAKSKGVEGNYLYFVKVDESIWYPGHIIPVVYFYKIVSEELLKLEDLKNMEYIPQFYYPAVYEKEPEKKKLYVLALINSSSRVIPKKRLTYIGRLEDVKRMQNEDTNTYQVFWKYFDHYIIKNFSVWNVF